LAALCAGIFSVEGEGRVGRKFFFFAKKKQKTFALWLRFLLSS
jgi:hypothetical protein